MKVSVGSICNTSNMYQLQGVEATDSMTPNSTVIFKMDKTTATSLLPQKLQGHVDDIVWVGSSDGFLYKVLGVFIIVNQLFQIPKISSTYIISNRVSAKRKIKHESINCSRNKVNLLFVIFMPFIN